MEVDFLPCSEGDFLIGIKMRMLLEKGFWPTLGLMTPEGRSHEKRIYYYDVSFVGSFSALPMGLLCSVYSIKHISIYRVIKKFMMFLNVSFAKQANFN